MSGYDTPVARSTAELIPLPDEAKRAEYYAIVEHHENFPKAGIDFVDMFPIFRHIGALKYMVTAMAELAKEYGTDGVMGVDSRGMVLGPLIAVELGVPFVPLRKAGKLPGKVISHTYSLEYGTATLEVQEGALPRSSRVIVVDDLLATGGTLAAGVHLARAVGYDVRAAIVIIELERLRGAKTVGVPTHTLLKC